MTKVRLPQNRRLSHALLSQCSSAISLTMPYSIVPATPDDLPDIIAIYHAAFADDPFIGQLMPNVPPEVKQAHDMHWYGREFEMSELNGLRFRKVVDGDGYDHDRQHFQSLNRALTCG